ncbi:quinone oxidoreductase putative [Exidia glandulosa HHB12029]|nr:quinone oxidoreductase putative [Exidia glandulosa HHB12029]
MSMRAILVNGGKGPVENLILGTAPRPTPAAHHVLVKVKSFGLNRMDIFQRMGKYPVPKHASEILGVEFSGTVAQTGTTASKWKEGDEVMGIAAGGAYAEYIAVPQTHVLPKPSQLSWNEAASVPEAWLTAFGALAVSCSIKRDEHVLVHTGASGVGVAANQLARFLGAKTVTTTASTDDKLAWLRRMPMAPTHTVNYKTADFAEEIARVTDGHGVDVLVDFVGKSHWEKNIASLAVDGRMVLLALLSGATVEKFSLQPFLYKRLRLEGSTLRARSEDYQTALIERFAREVLPEISGVDGPGKLKAYIHATYPWAQIQDATRELEANQNIGKVVAEID